MSCDNFGQLKDELSIIEYKDLIERYGNTPAKTDGEANPASPHIPKKNSKARRLRKNAEKWAARKRRIIDDKQIKE